MQLQKNETALYQVHRSSRDAVVQEVFQQIYANYSDEVEW